MSCPPLVYARPTRNIISNHTHTHTRTILTSFIYTHVRRRRGLRRAECRPLLVIITRIDFITFRKRVRVRRRRTPPETDGDEKKSKPTRNHTSRPAAERTRRTPDRRWLGRLGVTRVRFQRRERSTRFRRVPERDLRAFSKIERPQHDHENSATETVSSRERIRRFRGVVRAVLFYHICYCSVVLSDFQSRRTYNFCVIK